MAFGLTCKDLYAFLVKKQRRSLEMIFEVAHNRYEMLGSPKYRLLSQRAATLTFVLFGDEGFHKSLGSSSSFQDYPHRVSSEPMMAAACRSFYQSDNKLANSTKELTLSGHFPYYVVDRRSLCSYPFMRSNGFDAIRPETFKVDLSWRDWVRTFRSGFFLLETKARAANMLRAQEDPPAPETSFMTQLWLEEAMLTQDVFS